MIFSLDFRHFHDSGVFPSRNMIQRLHDLSCILYEWDTHSSSGHHFVERRSRLDGGESPRGIPSVISIVHDRLFQFLMVQSTIKNGLRVLVGIVVMYWNILRLARSESNSNQVSRFLWIYIKTHRYKIVKNDFVFEWLRSFFPDPIHRIVCTSPMLMICHVHEHFLSMNE